MAKSNRYVAIMAGGVGSRFWPYSREARPKQFLDILGVGKTLMQLTYERFLPLVPAENIFIVTNSIYRDLVKEQLPDILHDRILCEPSRNNTAPSVAYTAFKIHGINPNAVFVMAPSDHVILREDEFRSKISEAFDFAEANNALLTLGLNATRPDTGYGYINYDREHPVEGNVSKVIQFTEKPNHDTAVEFIRRGDYLWNAGIFIWSTKAILASFEIHTPELFQLFKKHEEQLNTAGEQAMIDEMYPTTPNISIDYAILEKAENVFTIPAEIGWSDLGTWGSLYEYLGKDENDNVVLDNPDMLMYDVWNCLIRTPKGKTVVLKDLENFIIIDQPDVLMIIPKHKEQEVKMVHADVKGKFGNGKM